MVTQLSPEHRQHLLAAKIEAAFFVAVAGAPTEAEILEAEASFHGRFGGPQWGRAFYVCVLAEIEKARTVWQSSTEAIEPRPAA